MRSCCASCAARSVPRSTQMGQPRQMGLTLQLGGGRDGERRRLVKRPALAITGAVLIAAGVAVVAL